MLFTRGKDHHNFVDKHGTDIEHDADDSVERLANPTSHSTFRVKDEAFGFPLVVLVQVRSSLRRGIAKRMA
jgi:hypothetical protein